MCFSFFLDRQSIWRFRFQKWSVVWLYAAPHFILCFFNFLCFLIWHTLPNWPYFLRIICPIISWKVPCTWGCPHCLIWFKVSGSSKLKRMIYKYTFGLLDIWWPLRWKWGSLRDFRAWLQELKRHSISLMIWFLLIYSKTMYSLVLSHLALS